MSMFADTTAEDEIPYIVTDIESGATLSGGGRFFFDYGTESLDSTYEEDHNPVRKWFRSQGYREGRNFRMQKYDGADHSERAWRSRVLDQLEWLLGDD